MKARLWNRDNDYETLVKWWNDWEFGIVPKDCLPKDGIIVEDDDKPICFTGLYSDPTTKFCIMEWTVIDKNISHIKSHKALQLCIDSVIKMVNWDDFNDYVIYLDEYNSLIEYFVDCPNLCNKRVSVWKQFNKMIEEADRVIMTDADISDNSINFIKSIPDRLREVRDKLLPVIDWLYRTLCYCHF